MHIKAEGTKEYKKVDFILLAVTLALLLYGLVMLFSASLPMSINADNIFTLIVKQLAVAALGCGVMYVVSRIDYHKYIKWAKPMILIGMAGMFVVSIMGFGSHGAVRQVSLGPISIQPSELAKIILVVYFAVRFSNKETSNLNNPKNVLISLGILGIYIFACILQSHMSAAVILAGITVLMMTVAGLPMRVFWGLGGIGLIGFACLAIFESYRLDRIIALFNPFKYSRGIGWQIIQSLYAVGSGGLWGLGLGQSRQKFDYLPEAHNDYIYGIVCEELGFVGGILCIVLFVLFVWRGMIVALNAKDRLGMLLAFGITSIVGLQMLVNIGVVLSILPSTGMQLPFFSAGGSSMLSMLTGVGILMNVSRSSRMKKF